MWESGPQPIDVDVDESGSVPGRVLSRSPSAANAIVFRLSSFFVPSGVGDGRDAVETTLDRRQMDRRRFGFAASAEALDPMEERGLAGEMGQTVGV